MITPAENISTLLSYSRVFVLLFYKNTSGAIYPGVPHFKKKCSLAFTKVAKPKSIRTKEQKSVLFLKIIFSGLISLCITFLECRYYKVSRSLCINYFI